MGERLRQQMVIFDLFDFWHVSFYFCLLSERKRKEDQNKKMESQGDKLIAPESHHCGKEPIALRRSTSRADSAEFPLVVQAHLLIC